ncbi:bromodomain and WD repeat-containing DDB_G0285837-like [Drosophila albomicans]|uniref:Bromodomain and WD repeat-containing DDB_G0285837-like n=1 Tax=Drosophila albomicans TaxID=7291 RepID=A0A6P8X3B3_DROAB|nr:bromodomain and WD repeat-containing DDB_G0285837-like [Drosophila albomicans]
MRIDYRSTTVVGGMANEPGQQTSRQQHHLLPDDDDDDDDDDVDVDHQPLRWRRIAKQGAGNRRDSLLKPVRKVGQPNRQTAKQPNS